MKITRCPSCHAHFNLDQCVQDEAGRNLLMLLAKLDSAVSMPLVGYIALFRPAKRDLANDRALRLMNEVLALSNNLTQLSTALVDTVESMKIKKDEGVFDPLKNHNYLQKVINSTPLQSRNAVMRTNTTQTAVFTSKTAQGLNALEALKRD